MFLNQCYRSSLLLRQCFLRNSVPLRSSSFLSILKRKPSIIKKTNYKIIYDFRMIRFVVGYIRSGVTSLALIVCSTPFVYIYFESLKPCFSLLLSACIHLIFVFAAAKMSKNMVGKMYVNKTGEITEVLISSIDEYGRRIDRVHKPNELINCEFFSKLSGKYGFIQISAKDSDLNYKVNIKNCTISDSVIWNNLFGAVTFPKAPEELFDIKEEKKKIE